MMTTWSTNGPNNDAVLAFAFIFPFLPRQYGNNFISIPLARAVFKNDYINSWRKIAISLDDPDGQFSSCEIARLGSGAVWPERRCPYGRSFGPLVKTRAFGMTPE